MNSHINFASSNKHRGYPVLNEKGRLIGVLTISDLLGDSILNADETRTASDLIQAEPIVAFAEETCRDAAERMATRGVGRLPVVSSEDPGKLIGIITRSDLLKPRLSHFEEEQKYERHLGPKLGFSG